MKALFAVVIAAKDFLQSYNSRYGQCDLADDQRFAGNRGDSLKAQGTGNAHSGKEGG